MQGDLERGGEARRGDAGFTLIELMVVVLIIGILIAIALPTFLGARARAQKKAATSVLRCVKFAGKTCYSDHDAYIYTGGACDNATLGPIEPSLNFVATGVRSEERRVGKECRARWTPHHEKEKKKATARIAAP